jgi:hypothetical protein
MGRYVTLLFAWLVLLPAIISSFKDRRRPTGLIIIAGLNLLAAINEAYLSFVWSKTVSVPIRLDIPLVIAVLATMNTLTGIRLLLPWYETGTSTRSAWIFKGTGMALIAISLSAATVLANLFVGARTDRADYQHGKLVEFQTMFRDAETVRHFFGDLGDDADHWAGHYVPASSGTWLTRLIVNREGKVWVFSGGGREAEFVWAHGQDVSLTKPDDSAAVRLNFDVGSTTNSLAMRRRPAGRIVVALMIPGRPEAQTTADFVRSAPPVFPQAVSAGEVEYLGVFSNGYVQSDVLFAVQLWMWRHDGHVFGRYLRQSGHLGTEVLLIFTKSFIGRYDRDGNRVSFTINDQESFAGALSDDRSLNGEILWLGRPLETIRLTKGKELIPGLDFQLAPTAGEQITRDWLEMWSHRSQRSSTWQVPSSFDPSTW